MNNNWADQGQRNAAMLIQVLADRYQARVPRLVLPASEPVEQGSWVAEPV
jgi:hypothetical protein